jgi:hypothetical protein
VTRFVSEALAKHARAAFLSGNDRVDLYFRETVSQVVKRKYAACYDLIERSTGKVAGFYMLSAHSIPMNDVAPELAKKLPRYPSVPVVLIGWMGRDLAFRGAGVGSLLLYDAISRVSKAPIPHCQEWPKGGAFRGRPRAVRIGATTDRSPGRGASGAPPPPGGWWPSATAPGC